MRALESTPWTSLGRAASRAPILAALALVGLARPADAAEVSLHSSTSFTWTGDSVVLQITVSNPERGMSVPELEPVPGLAIRGPFGPSQEMQLVNGRQSVSLRYQYEATPASATTGKLTIGPATVRRTGQAALQSNKLELHVYKRPKAGILFDCKVTPAGGPILNPFRVVYTVSYTGEAGGGNDDDFFPSIFSRRSPFGITALNLPILELSSLRLKPIQVLPGQEGTSLRISSGAQIHVQESFASNAEGEGFKTLVFGFEATPTTTGDIQLGAATVAMQLGTGRRKVGRDRFGRQVEAPEVADYRASTEKAVYRVQPLPEAGRPPGFTGAVGRFTIALSASPIEVDAFAPITLEVRVSGEGLLEDLKPAAWSEVEALTRDFDVSTDVDPGKIDGRAKVFRQVIRPRSEKVTQIPPVPFPFFDPKAGHYQVAHSQPIPIKVRAVQTVTSDQALPARAGSEPKSKAGPEKRIERIVEKAGIGANFRDPGKPRPALDPRDEVFSAPFLAAVIAPPAIFFALAAALRLRARDPVARRRARALAQATARIAGAREPVELARAVEDYFREKLDLPAGEVTPGEVARALESRSAPEKLRAAAASLLERLHAAKYGGGVAAAEAAAEARGTLEEVERCLRA